MAPQLFGATAKGGRGGRIIKVTTLKADGPGSLNEACRAKGPRIVVFEVGGATPGDVHALRVFENPGNANDWITLKLVGTSTWLLSVTNAGVH